MRSIQLTHSARILAAVLAGLLAIVPPVGCTRTVPARVETRNLTVNWAALGLPKLDMDAIQVQGMVFTPAQWPLQASAKRMFAGDFIGVVDALDLSFRSSTLPDDEALQELFKLGYLPAYARIENRGQHPARFMLSRVALEVDDARWWRAVDPERLPGEIAELDWQRMGLVAAAVAINLLIVMILLAAHGSGGGSGAGFPTTATPGGPPEPGEVEFKQVTLRSGTLAPGEAREGLLLFAIDGEVGDWRSAKLVVF